MTIRQEIQLSPPSVHRHIWMLLALLLWIFQVRYPPLSYPALGLVTVAGLAAFGLFGVARIFRKSSTDAGAMEGWQYASHPALLPGFLFVSWTCLRWIAAGTPAAATAEVTLPFWAAAWCLAALFLTRPPGTKPKPAPALQFPLLFLLTLTVAGLVCGIYAIFQYHSLYHETYRTLLADIGSRRPDRTEAALLHHLNLRRVASFWGDPNSYAAFAALSIAASIEVILSAETRRIFWRSLATLSILASLLGIFYTGSRGGVLDVALVGACFAVALIAKRRSVRLVSAMVLALILIMNPGHHSGAVAQAPQAPPAALSGAESAAESAAESGAESAWLWRSDTIRERLYYLQVGGKMIAMAPIAGLGPGSVNDYFGELKSPRAREARHLHNWLANTWAELGLIGIILLCWMLGAILWRARRLVVQPVYRTCLVLFGVVIFDGMIQTSWDQRELMSTFGIIIGCLISASSTPPANGPRQGRLILRATASLIIIGGLLIIELPYLSAANYKQIAHDAIIAGDRQTALRYYEKAQRRAPGDSEIYQARAYLALESGQLSAARMLYRKALSLAPRSAALNSQLAEVNLALKDAPGAEQHLRRALELYPSHPGYNLQFARFLEAAGRLDEARSYGQRALDYSYLPEESAEIRDFLHHLR